MSFRHSWIQVLSRCCNRVFFFFIPDPVLASLRQAFPSWAQKKHPQAPPSTRGVRGKGECLFLRTSAKVPGFVFMDSAWVLCSFVTQLHIHSLSRYNHSLIHLPDPMLCY